MTPHDDYLREKLMEACDALEHHPDAIKTGLEAAFRRFVPIEPGDLSEPYRSAFAEIRSALLAHGDINATLDVMEESAASAFADSIYALLDMMLTGQKID